MSAIGYLIDLIFPRSCPVCGRKLLGAERQLCTQCAMEMPLTYFWTMEHNIMADKLNAKIDDGTYQPYSYATALYFYKGDYREISKALKYNANLPLGRYSAEALARKIKSSSHLRGIDLILPVPLHWMRRLKRGYNQAEVIADTIASQLPARSDRTILKRSKHTKSQANLAVKEKSANVHGAFTVDMERLRAMLFSEQSPRHILLIDDVFTTGATLSECHMALRNALKNILGPKEANKIRISVATLAFVGE